VEQEFTLSAPLLIGKGALMSLSARFPADVEAVAFRTADEYAWQKKDLHRVLECCLTSCVAILGGEAWVVRRLEDCSPDDPTEPKHNLDPLRREKGNVLARTKTHVVYGSLLLRDGRHEICAWDLYDARLRSKSWSEYVNTTINETWEVIQNMNLELEVIPKYAQHVYYNLTFDSQE
jgi:hypothetical protein